jgi:hypothetical protein
MTTFVPHRPNRYFQNLTTPTQIVFAFVLYITRDDRYISDRTGLVLQNPLKVHNSDVASLHPRYAIAASSYPTFGDFAAMLLIAPQVRFQRRRSDPCLPSSIDGDAGPMREDPPSGSVIGTPVRVAHGTGRDRHRSRLGDSGGWPVWSPTGGWPVWSPTGGWPARSLECSCLERGC